MVGVDRCLADLIDWFKRTGGDQAGSKGKTFDPGYLVFDWDDSGAMAPILGVSTGIPIGTGTVPPEVSELTGETDVRFVFLSYDASESGIGANIGAPPPMQTAGASVDRAEDAAKAKDETPDDPKVITLRPLGSASISLLDKTGNATFELNCTGKVQAWRYVPRTGTRSGRPEPEVLMVACPNGFVVY